MENTKTAELILSGDQYTGSALKLISPVLLSTDPSKKTRLFGMVQSPNTKLFKIIEEIINFAEIDGTTAEQEMEDFDNFPSPQLAVESQLETLLQNINNKLNIVLSEKEMHSTILNTNIVIGLQNDDALSLAGRGEMRVVIIRTKENHHGLMEDESYEILNLFKQTGVTNELDDEDELFSHFLSGKICHGDAIIFSTKNLWDKIKEENLLRGVAVLPPTSAVEFIKNNLPKWRGGGATALIIKYGSSEKSQQINMAPQRRFGRAFKNSIEELMGTERKTEKILSTPVPFKKSFFLFFELFSPKGKNQKIGEKFNKNRNVSRILRKIFDQSLYILGLLINFSMKLTKRLYRIAIDKDRRSNLVEEIKTDFKKGRGGFISWFNSLPKRSRILFVLTIFLIFVFTQSIFIFSIKQGYNKKKEEHEILVQRIKNASEEAEASLIYGDDKKAEKLLEEAMTMFTGLSKKTKKEKGQATYLKEILNEKWSKLYHLIDVAEPRLLADLGNTGGEFLIESNGSIYALSPENATILKMNPDSGQVSPHVIFEGANEISSFWSQKNEQSVIVFEINNLPDQTEMQINSAKELSLNNKNIKPLNSSEITERIKDLKIFNDKLYTLDIEQNQIWRHSLVSSSFTQGKNWLKENDINLKDALALALDGSIYVLKSNGELIKLYAGKNTNFNAKIPKPINREGEFNISMAKIWTSTNSRFIYVLDQENNRIIVFDKNGKLAAQYVSPIFTNLKDFAIQEKEHKIYVLNDTQVYGIIASHVDFRQVKE